MKILVKLSLPCASIWRRRFSRTFRDERVEGETPTIKHCCESKINRVKKKSSNERGQAYGHEANERPIVLEIRCLSTVSSPEDILLVVLYLWRGILAFEYQ